VDKEHVSFHTGAVTGFNKAGDDLVAQVTKRQSHPQSGKGESRFVPRATLRKEDVWNVRNMTTDVTGTVLSKFAEVDNNHIGLGEEPYKALRLLSEKIQRTEGFRELVSQKALEEAIFDWVLDRSLERSTQELCQRLVAEFNFKIKEYWVWIPVHGLASDFDIEVGRVEIHPFRPAFFETWEGQLKQINCWDSKSQAIVNHAKTEFQGHAACTMKVVAEPTRAREIAFAEAENALAILRALQPCIMHPQIPSFIRPWGREHVQGSSCIFIVDNMAQPPDSHGEEPFEYWTLDKEMVDALNTCGLGGLHYMYREMASDYEKELWTSIWTYSNSSLQKTPEDRLIYVFRALESFLLKSKNEPIQQNIADRIAFTISDKADERRAIAKTVVKVYGLRSDSVHHNQSIEETELLIEFLQYVFRFFLLAIGRRKEFTYRKDFLESLDALKYA